MGRGLGSYCWRGKRTLGRGQVFRGSLNQPSRSRQHQRSTACSEKPFDCDAAVAAAPSGGGDFLSQEMKSCGKIRGEINQLTASFAICVSIPGSALPGEIRFLRASEEGAGVRGVSQLPPSHFCLPGRSKLLAPVCIFPAPPAPLCVGQGRLGRPPWQRGRGAGPPAAHRLPPRRAAAVSVRPGEAKVSSWWEMQMAPGET